MTDAFAGSYVIVKTKQGALIGGTFWGPSADGALFVMKVEICLNMDFASNPSEWEVLPADEAWCGYGEVVDDPRGKS